MSVVIAGTSKMMRLRRTSPRNDKIECHPELDSGSHNRTEKSFDDEIAYQVRYDRNTKIVITRSETA